MIHLRDNSFRRLTCLFQYTTNYKLGEPAEFGQKAMYNGNNTKSMHVSVGDSMKKLRTDYIDLLYVHWWDYSTPIEEVMNGLHNLVSQGKVLYLVRKFRIITRNFLTNYQHNRESLTPQHGSSPRPTLMLVLLARLPSSSTRVHGVFSSGISSVIFFPWPSKRVSIELIP